MEYRDSNRERTTSGLIDEENVIGSDDEDWEAKWRLLFKKVTVADLNKFTKEYQGQLRIHSLFTVRTWARGMGDDIHPPGV